jgi:PTH1 family peptidyl-tRNA hydrolase
VKTGGGAAGHNGIRSMIAHIGEGFRRVRIGIGHPGHKDVVSSYVLSDFAKADAPWLDDLLRGISDGAPDLARGDASRFMNTVALRTAPPRPPAARPEDAGRAPRETSDGGSASEAEPPRGPFQRLADWFR